MAQQHRHVNKQLMNYFLWGPRKIAVGQKTATGRACSADESHALVRVRNLLFEVPLRNIDW